MRTLKVVLLMGILAALLSACTGNSKNDDASYAEKYKGAVTSITHVQSVDSSYKSNAGMGRTGDVFITADTDDRTAMLALLKKAFPAIVNAAAGDPEARLEIRVTSSTGDYSVSPLDLGYSSSLQTLSSYRDFLTAHPELNSAG
ncbi:MULTISPECIES: hypothetical protein [Arthrobacter]|uniref:Uncharacterized protein n=2 Tax=Arthrobacter TaxID=1663 RepID=A0ABU9KHR9_9MICC|nr:hypothetical protein [Arthrobacter sp. YJM1]MDP5226550.1 hypothetical protein [Arthrobacter sp. YJM1]